MHLTGGTLEVGLFYETGIHFEKEAKQRWATILTVHAHAYHTLLKPDVASSILMGAAMSRVPIMPEGVQITKGEEGGSGGSAH